MRGWLIFACVMAVIVLLFLLPVRVHVTLFDGKTGVEVRYLFLRLRFPPEKKKKKSGGKAGKKKKAGKAEGKKKPPKPKPGKEKRKKPWDAERIRQLAQLITGALRGLGRAGGFFLRGLRIDTLRLQMQISRADAFQTAFESGKINAAVYPAAALIQSWMRVRDLYLNIYPGFWTQEETIAFEVRLRVSPARGAGAACVLAGSVLGTLLHSLLPRREKAPPASRNSHQ